MAGLSAQAGDVNRACGNAVVALAQALSQCTALNTMLNDTSRGFGQAGLVALGFTSADAALLLASFADLTNLAAVASGQQAQPAASNFLFNAAKLMGVTPL
jgi:hypothetical protein